MPRSTFLTPLANGGHEAVGGDEGALPSSAARLDLGGENTRTFPCMSSRMVSVTFNPPSMTPVSILGCVGSGQALSAVRSLVAG